MRIDALDAAEASVAQTEATLGEARANLDRLRQVAELSGGKVPSKTELTLSKTSTTFGAANTGSIRVRAGNDPVSAKAVVRVDGKQFQTLQIGDHLLVTKFAYGVKIPFTNVMVVERDGQRRTVTATPMATNGRLQNATYPSARDGSTMHSKTTK